VKMKIVEIFYEDGARKLKRLPDDEAEAYIKARTDKRGHGIARNTTKAESKYKKKKVDKNSWRWEEI